MPRTIESYSPGLTITALDAQGFSGESRHFRVERGSQVVELVFQNDLLESPVEPHGLTDLAVLAIVLDRLMGRQSVRTWPSSIDPVNIQAAASYIRTAMGLLE